MAIDSKTFFHTYNIDVIQKLYSNWGELLDNSKLVWALQEAVMAEGPPLVYIKSEDKYYRMTRWGLIPDDHFL